MPLTDEMNARLYMRRYARSRNKVSSFWNQTRSAACVSQRLLKPR